jgi:hypothetical protein
MLASQPSQAGHQGSPDGCIPLWGMKERGGRAGAGEIMGAPTIGGKQVRQRSAEHPCRKRNKRAQGTAWQRNKKPQWLSCLSLVAPSCSCDL